MYVECDFVELPEVKGFDRGPEPGAVDRLAERLAELKIPGFVIRRAGSFANALQQTNELLAPYGICEVGSRTAFVSGVKGLKEARKTVDIDSMRTFLDMSLTLHVDMNVDEAPEVIMWWNGYGVVESYFLRATQAMHDGYPSTDLTMNSSEEFRDNQKVDDELLVPTAWHTVASAGEAIIFIDSGPGAAAHVFRPQSDRYSLAVEYGYPEMKP